MKLESSRIWEKMTVMLEYATVIEIWFLANNEDNANEIVKELCETILINENVIQIEGEAPEFIKDDE